MSFSSIYSLQPPKCKANLFLSSSSADCKVERELLFNYIVPRLRDEHSDDNIDITVSDMRWGIVDPRSDLHHSWKECAAEIKRCHNESHSGFFFLTLQSDKYGHTIMPQRIDKEKFELCLAENVHMYENRVVVIDKDTAGGGHATDDNIQDMIKNLKNQDSNRSLAAIAKLWYELDETSTQHAYALKELTEATREESVEDKICLLKFFENITCHQDMLFDSNDEPLVVNRSVSEFEIKYAFSLAADGGNSGGGGGDGLTTPLWVHRQFVHNGNIYSYDKSSVMKMKNLKAWMIGELSSARHHKQGVCELSISFEEYIAGKGDTYELYLEAWTQRVYIKYAQSVQHVLRIREDWWKHWCKELDLSHFHLQELCFHYQYAQEQVNQFAGRKEDLTLALQQVGTWRLPYEVNGQAPLAGLCLYIVGKPGLGKSALMAKIAHELRQVEEEKTRQGQESSPVISRFCGLTAESMNGLSLVHSICVEIYRHLNIPDWCSIPTDYEGVVQCLHRLLKERSVILLVDGLDNITHEHQAGGHMLSFLTNIYPHMDSRIVVSARLDEKEKRSQHWAVCYGCDSRLKESNVFRVEMSPFEDKTSEFAVDSKSEALLVVRSFTEEHGKGKAKPARSQINKLLKRLACDRPPTPLAVILASRLLLEQDHITRFQVEKTDSSLIAQSFRFLENQFGKRLAMLAFSFITLSVKGITDMEMLDLLSLDDELNEILAEYRSCSKHRVATHLWQRLKRNMGILLKENKHGRLEWTHRRVKTYVTQKYPEAKYMKKYIHQLMGQYFANIVPKSIQEERGTAEQPVTLTNIPVWFHNTSVNKRRYEEGLFHLIEANLLTEACNEVCNLDNICAFFKSGLGIELTKDIIKLHRAIVHTGEAERSIFTFSESFFHKVDCYMRWIRQMNGEIEACTPDCGIFTTVSATQPTYSDALIEACQLHDAAYNMTSKNTYFENWPSVTTTLSQFTHTSWNRGVCFSANIQFQSLISTFQHSDPVKCVDWLTSKNDTQFVSVAKKEIFIWDAIKNHITCSFALFSDVFCAVTNRNATKLACGSKDRVVRIYDLASGLIDLTLTGHVGFVSTLCFSNCNTKICSGSTDCAIYIWNLQGGSIIKSFEGHSFEVTQVMFSPDDKRIVSGSLDKTVKMWEIETGDVIFSLDQMFSYVHSVCFDPSGEKIAVGSSDGVFILNSWSAEEDGPLFTLEGHEAPVMSVAFSPDGSQLASGSLDHTLKIWHVPSGIMVGSVNDHTDGINFVKFSYDSQKVMTASKDETVRFFDVATELLTPIESRFDSLFEGSKKCINSVSFSPNGKILLSTSGCEIFIWEVCTRKLLTTLNGHEDTVTAASYNTSNSKICSCGVDGCVLVWDALTYEVLASLKKDVITAAVFTLDGYKVVLRSADYKVLFWDYFADIIVHEFNNPRQLYCRDPYQVNLVTFFPEGLLKTMSIVNVCETVNGVVVEYETKQEIQIWDCVSNVLVSTLEAYPPHDEDVDEDEGEEVAEVQINAKKKEKNTDNNHDNNYNNNNQNNASLEKAGNLDTVLARSFSFSSDGLSIAVGYTDGAIIMSNIVSGKANMTLLGHTGMITSLCFNIEGTRIVSGSVDCSVKVWDLHGGLLVTTLRGHSSALTYVTYSTCGLLVASASEDKTLMLWDAVEIQTSQEDSGEEVDALEPTSGLLSDTFVSQMSAVIGSVETVIDPDDEFLTEDEKRIKSYQFQYVDGW